jgi:hypothetical protein
VISPQAIQWKDTIQFDDVVLDGTPIEEDNFVSISASGNQSQSNTKVQAVPTFAKLLLMFIC